MKRSALVALLVLGACAPSEDGVPAAEKGSAKRQAVVTAFPSGSIIIPMDTTSQDNGTLRAFGLLHRLLQANIPVNRIALGSKTGNNDVDFSVTATQREGGAALGTVNYSAGPFVIDASNAAAAFAIIDPYLAGDTVTRVHVATAAFSADVQRTLIAAPRIAVFEDGYQTVAYAYLNGANIPDPNGNTWSNASPGAITIAQVAGAATGGAFDGVLINADGTPAYDQLTSMHYDAPVNSEAIREVRGWLNLGPITHAFMECEAINAFENNANGHFLSDLGLDDDGATVTPVNVRQPTSLFAQFSGTLTVDPGLVDSIGLNAGSTLYANSSVLVDRSGSPLGTRMVYLTGFLDGNTAKGKVSYLAGHNYSTTGPISTNPTTNGTRLFLDGLYETPAITSTGQPAPTITKSAPAATNALNYTFTINYSNPGTAPAYNATITDVLPVGTTFVSATGGGVNVLNTVTWTLGNLAAGASGSVTVTVTSGQGTFNNSATLGYRVGSTNKTLTSNTTTTIVDRTAPAAPVVATPANGAVTNVNTPTYTGTAEANSTVTVRVDTVAVCTVTATAAGTFTCTPVTPLADGAHSVNATTTDAAGNTSLVSNTNTFTVDTAAPAAPVVVAPANGSSTNNTSPTYSGTAEANSTVTVRVDGVVRCTVTASAAGAWSCTPALVLTAGSHTVNATATDAGGNVSPASATNTFTVDTTPPAAPVMVTPANGSSTNNTSPTYSGTAEANSTVTVRVDGVVRCTTTASAAGAFSCTPAFVLTAGSHTVNATATDAAGNTSVASNTNTFTVDTTAPAAPVVTAPANGAVTNVNTPTYAGTAEANSTVTVRVDGNPVCVTAASAAGAFSCTPAGALADGSHTVNATATDAAGNTSVVSNTNTFTVDTGVPPAPVVVAPANGASTNNASPTYSGTAEANSTVTVRVDGVVRCTVTASAAGAWSCTPALVLTAGSHTVNATATDAGGNVSPASATNTFTVDTTPPAAPVVVAPANGSSTNNTSPTYSGTAEANSTVTVRVDGVVRCTVTASAAGAWTCTPAFVLAAGSHTVNATATDAAGNTSVVSNTNTFTVDTTAPAAPVVTGPANGAVTNVNTPTYTGTAEANSTVTVRVDGVVRCTVAASAAGAFTCTPAGALADGSHTVNATATDAAGNTSVVSNTNTFTVDTGVPAAPVVTAPANGSSTNNASPTYSGTAEANSTVTVRVDGVVRCTVTASAAGAWSCTPALVLTAGSHTVNATATDAGGNVSPASATNTFTVDTTAPAAPVVVAPANGSTIATATPTYTGTAEANSTVTVRVDGAVVCTAVATAAGAFSCVQPAPLAAGSHTVNATSADAAGNTSAASNTNTFTVNLSVPTTPVVTAPANGSSVGTGTPTYTGTADPGTTVTVTVDGSTACTATTTAAGTWSCTPAASIADGTHTVSAIARNAANTPSAPSATNTFTVDTGVPAVPVVVTPANGAQLSTATPTYTGTAEANSTVTVRVDGAVACTTTASATGAFSCAQPTALADGAHSVTATATDAAGNASPASTANAFTIDTGAPAAPVITAPANNSSSSNPLPVYSGTAEANSTVTVTVDGAVACTATASATGAWSCTQPTALADGAHTVTATAKDAGNNTSPASPVTNFTIDTAAPDTAIVSAPPAMDPSNAATFDFSSPEAGVTFECSLDGAAFTACTDPVTFSGLAQGAHALSVRAKDAAGNVDATPATHAWTVTSAPAIDTTIVSGPPALTNSASAPFDFSSNTANVTYECSIDGAAFAACTDPTTITGLPDGLHSLRVRAKDAMGNVDTSPAMQTWTQDTVPPSTPVVTSPANASTVGDTTPTITGTGEPGATVTVLIDGTPVGTAVVGPTGTWTFVPTVPLTNGPHTVTATQKDPAGNTGPASAPVTFTVDASVLDTSIVSGPAPLTGSKTAAFDFESNKAGVTYECSLDGAAFAPCTDPASFTNLADGPHTLLVRAKDGSGTTDASPASWVWKVDSVAPPAAVVVTPANGATLGTPTPTVTGTAEPGATVTVLIDGVSVGTTVADASGKWSLPLTAPLAAGPHTVSARATDPAGNTGPVSAVNTFTIDLTVLDTTIVSGPMAVSRFPTAAFDLSSNQANVTYECSLDGGAFVACTDPATFTGLADGSHTLLVRAKDAMGNVDTTPASFTWKVDTVAPAAPVVTAPANGAVITDNKPTLAGTAEPGATVTVKVDGVVVGVTTADATGKWSLPTTAALANGSHTVNATAVDAAGNQSPASATNTFTVTMGGTVTAPTITSPTGGSSTGDATPTISGTAPPNSTVDVYVDGVKVGTTTADGNGNWSFTVPTNLADGPHTITADATKGGVTSTKSTPVTVTIDTTGPDVTIVKSPPDPNINATASFEFASKDPGATFECSVDGGAFGPCGAKHDLNGLSLGMHTLSVRAVDAVGNRSASKSVTWTQAESIPQPTPEQRLIGGGCACSQVDAGALFGLLAFAGLLRRRRAR